MNREKPNKKNQIVTCAKATLQPQSMTTVMPFGRNPMSERKLAYDTFQISHNHGENETTNIVPHPSVPHNIDRNEEQVLPTAEEGDDVESAVQSEMEQHPIHDDEMVSNNPNAKKRKTDSVSPRSSKYRRVLRAQKLQTDLRSTLRPHINFG